MGYYCQMEVLVLFVTSQRAYCCHAHPFEGRVLLDHSLDRPSWCPAVVEKLHVVKKDVSERKPFSK